MSGEKQAIGPRFKVFVPMLKASREEDGRMRLHGIASSTIKDLHGDVMSRSAIEDMQRSAVGLTMFLNHSYTVPEDVGGTITAAHLSDWVDGTGTDLPVEVEVNKANPRAVNAFESIEGGTQLGISIGALIPEGGAKWDKKSGGFIIEHVQLLEASLVGIPANPRSWVEYATKAIKGAGDDFFFETIEDVETDVTEMDVEDKAPKQHQHPHAHGHEHEHTHGWGSSESTHGHEHAHRHSHEHGDEHEHNDTMNDSEHDHWHRSGEDGDHAHDGSVYNSAEGALEDRSHPELDIVEATSVTVTSDDGTIDVEIVGDSGDDSPTSQDAQESIPETEDSLLDESGLGEEALLSDTQTKSSEEVDFMPAVFASLESGSAAVEVLTSEVMTLRSRVVEAEMERDEALAMARRALTDTATILETLAATPVGRRAVVREASNEFEHLSGVYSEEFLKMLSAR
jgi:HK97 family phage prohead protease